MVWVARSLGGLGGGVKALPEDVSYRQVLAERRESGLGTAGLHSITWSARPSTDGGIVRPRALAVLRLMISLRSQPAYSSDLGYLLTLGGERCGKDSNRGVEERSTLHYSIT